MRALPSEKVFRIFEACATYQSFTIAGDHLGITQSAVSQQIKGLEETLGVELFYRVGRQVRLSPKGKNVLEAQRKAFQLIRDSVGYDVSKSHKISLSVLVHPGFSVRWLLPRLGDFRRVYPGIDLTVQTTEDIRNFYALETDIAIFHTSFHREEWLFQDTLIPVASSKFIREHKLEDMGPHDRLQWIASAPLFGETPSHMNDTWQSWSQAVGVPIAENCVQRYSQSNMSLLLAELGQGVAMGRMCLIVDAIEAGVLVPLSNKIIPAETGYVFRSNSSRPWGQGHKIFQSWIEEKTEDFMTDRTIAPFCL